MMSRFIVTSTQTGAQACRVQHLPGVGFSMPVDEGTDLRAKIESGCCFLLADSAAVSVNLDNGLTVARFKG